VAEPRTIGQLAELVGAFRFVEHSLFALCGKWAAESVGDGPSAAEATVFLATSARHHGDVAETWRGRLPVRAGVDQDALITAPAAVVETFERLGMAIDPLDRLRALLEVPMVRLLDTYGAVQASGNPASEAPVLAALGAVRREGLAELKSGQSICDRLVHETASAGQSKALVVELERAFGRGIGIFPGEWPT
jgi:hypothetical protein